METAPEKPKQSRLMSKRSALAGAALLAPLPVFAVLVTCWVQYWAVPNGWVILGSFICFPLYISYVAFIVLKMRKWSEENDIDRVWWMDGYALFDRLRHPAPSEQRYTKRQSSGAYQQDE
ncbi:hypothetical protein [Pseudoclavibacter sp. RFBB5]|uniref:hypothetical protein n=1 Tax=Pseudoclavibacter sp. RFBB5 TaxID=2080574 RepID=UPI0011B0A755|nr:hypothetical protein [Pseudoclavibacter sp. RFBB5]